MQSNKANLNITPFSFRAIFKPFKPKLKNTVIILTSIIIVVCSLALAIHVIVGGHKSWRISFQEGRIFYVQHTTVLASMCYFTYPKLDKILLYSYILIYSIGLWFPAIILFTLHFIMYHKLKKEAQIRTNTSTMDSTLQMRRMMKTFSVIVIAFYICMIPHSILHTYLTHTVISGKVMNRKLYYTMSLTFTCLQNINSCLNPLIYAKIHLKICSALKRVWHFVASCTFKTSSISQQSETSSIEMRGGIRKRESVNSQLSSSGDTVESRL